MNVRFRDMLDKHMEKCEQEGKKGGKNKVSAYIVRTVKEEGAGGFSSKWKKEAGLKLMRRSSESESRFCARRGVFQATLEKGKITAGKVSGVCRSRRRGVLQATLK